MRLSVFFFAIALNLVGCSFDNSYKSNFMIGSSISKNIFVDSSQFSNRNIKLRLRNSSGDLSIDPGQIRASIEKGLLSAGYNISDNNFGILLDVNIYFVNSVSAAKQSQPIDLSILLGGVVGYEIARSSGVITPGSGAILGGIAGATLHEILKSNNDFDSYIVLSEVNIGVAKQKNIKKDNFTIGGNRFDLDDDVDGTFDAFDRRETLKVAVYAGDSSVNRNKVMIQIQNRLVNILSNLL